MKVVCHSWRVLLRRTAIFVFMTITAILAFMSILTKFVTDTDLARRLAEYRGQPSFCDNCAAKYKATSKFAPNYVNVRFSSKLLDMTGGILEK